LRRARTRGAVARNRRVTARINEQLGDGAKVRAVVKFRGREREHPERGRDLIARLADDVRDVGRLEGMPVAEGRTLVAVIAPLGAAR